MALRRVVMGIGTLALGLACAGLPTAPVAEVSLAPELQELVEAEASWEAASPEQRAARGVMVQAFTTGTPDFAEWRPVALDCLKSTLCPTVEAAYQRAKADFAPKEPHALEVTGDDWAAVLVVSNAYATSEDWAAFPLAVTEAWAEVVPVVPMDRGRTAVSAGGMISELPAEARERLAVGYVVVKAKGFPEWVAHDTPERVTERVAELTGKCPKAGCPEKSPVAAEPEPEPASGSPRPGPRGRPSPEPEPVAVAPAPEPEPEPVSEELPEDLEGLVPVPTPEPAGKKGKKGR